MTQPWQFHIRQQTYTFTFKWGFTLLCVFFFVLCCVLGVWQLQRYQFKKNLITLYQQHKNAAPGALPTTADKNLQFMNVATQGHYLNDLTILIQNRVHQNQMGYEVITPLQIPGEQKLLLVDRGWISEDTSTEHLPNVNSDELIRGQIKLLNEYQFILGENLLSQSPPFIVQKIDVAQLEKLLGHSLYPFLLRLDASQPHGFLREWSMTTIVPQRHMAYAVQWFALAIVLLIAYVGFCCERVRNK